jgi:1-pyrroline-4-hydroxy-2-carboxylate deaminase
MSAPVWKGVFPAALTHFHEDLSIDMAATTGHIEAMLEAGIHGLVLLGTCGENNSLEPEEKLAVLEAGVRAAKGRVPVLTGVSELTTARAVRFAKQAEDRGVAGLMVLPAMAYKADPREVVHHFSAVARAVQLPIMVYNNPVSYKVDIDVETLRRLADIPNITYVKESSDNPRRITDIFNALGDRFRIFAGVDDLALESLMLGATGWISGLVSAFPRENRLLWDLAMAGKWEEARAVYRWYTPALHLDTEVKLVQYIKLAAQECGYGSERVRPPRLALEGAERERVLDIVRKAKATRPQGR